MAHELFGSDTADIAGHKTGRMSACGPGNVGLGIDDAHGLSGHRFAGRIEILLIGHLSDKGLPVKFLKVFFLILGEIDLVPEREILFQDGLHLFPSHLVPSLGTQGLEVTGHLVLGSRLILENLEVMDVAVALGQHQTSGLMVGGEENERLVGMLQVEIVSHADAGIKHSHLAEGSCRIVGVTAEIDLGSDFVHDEESLVLASFIIIEEVNLGAEDVDDRHLTGLGIEIVGQREGVHIALFLTLEQQHLVLSYDGKNLAEITFEEGCGRLTGAALGLRKAAEENPEIKAVLSCAIKMKGGADSPEIRALVNDEQVTLPSFEERRDNVLAVKPNSHALNRDWYRYYEKAALQDLTAATKEEVMAGMVKIMEKDGLRPVKIANIARTNPGFKNDLLPVKVYGASKSKIAGGEKSASTARDAGKHAGQNLTMEEQANRAAREATKKEQKDLIKAAAKEAQKKKLSPKESLLQGLEGGKGQERKMEMGK